MNKYVSFVSDEDFLEAVKKVIFAYPNYLIEESAIDVLKNSGNTIDEFKTIFDVCVNQISFAEWSKSEITRQNDKTINNKIGEFHQELLGKVPGWVDLGVGDETEVDLKKEDNTIFIELKNKYNTMNSSSTKTCREKLENILKHYPDAIVYWAYIISKDYKSTEEVWVYKGQVDNRIRKITGDKVYELITGDPHALEKTFVAIPKAINDILEEGYVLKVEDEEIMEEYKKYIFKD